MWPFVLRLFDLDLPKLGAIKLNNSFNNYNSKENNMRRQDVLSAPATIVVGQYTTKSGQVKNKSVKNPDSKVIKTIYHLN